jgi:hypothetical protein
MTTTTTTMNDAGFPLVTLSSSADGRTLISLFSRGTRYSLTADDVVRLRDALTAWLVKGAAK